MNAKMISSWIVELEKALIDIVDVDFNQRGQQVVKIYPQERLKYDLICEIVEDLQVLMEMDT